MSDEDRRQNDRLLLSMHGSIETLLERSKNAEGWMKALAETQEKQDNRISDNAGEITGMKRVAGLISLIFLGVTAVFGARK